MKYKCSEGRDGGVWRRIILLGVIGGPVVGGIFGAAFWAVGGFFGSSAYPVQTAQTVMFMVAGLAVGAVIGLACGVSCSIVAVAGYSITQKLGGAVRASTSGVLAGATAMVLSYILIGPTLSTFNPAIFAAVLGPTVGLAYFLVPYRRLGQPMGRILQP